MSETPSLLPYDADVHIVRNQPKFLAARTEPIWDENNTNDVYLKFFENNQLRKNRILYGSDASVNDDGRGAFARDLKDRDNPNNMLLKYHSPIHGDHDQIHSTRGEMFGALECLRHIIYIMSKYSSAIQIASNPFYLSFKKTFDKDADIKTELHIHYKRAMKYVSLHHVKSH